MKALEEMKFSSPTEIQRVSIPVSVYGKTDILGAAPTGSGKTLGDIFENFLVLQFVYLILFYSFWNTNHSKHPKNSC